MLRIYRINRKKKHNAQTTTLPFKSTYLLMPPRRAIRTKQCNRKNEKRIFQYNENCQATYIPHEEDWRIILLKHYMLCVSHTCVQYLYSTVHITLHICVYVRKLIILYLVKKQKIIQPENSVYLNQNSIYDVQSIRLTYMYRCICGYAISSYIISSLITSFFIILS